MAIEEVSDKLIYGPRSAGPLERVYGAFENQENRLQERLGKVSGTDPKSNELSKFLEQTFRNLQGKFNDPIEQQTFQMVKTEMLASHKGNAEAVQRKIRNRIKDIQLELSMKAASKTGQGLQQLLSSQ